MQVDRRDDRRPRPGGGAHHRIELAVGVRAAGRDHAAVVADVDRVQLSRGLQAIAHRGEGRLEKALVHRAAWLAGGDDDRDRRPRAERVHFAVERRDFGRKRRRFLSRLAADLFAGAVAERAEVALLAHRRERVALQVKAENGDPRARNLLRIQR